MNAPTKSIHFARTRSQADYDAWLAKEVQEALDDPRPLVAHSEVLRRSAIRRVELLKRAKLKAA
jgi:hypothetical protein